MKTKLRKVGHALGVLLLCGLGMALVILISIAAIEAHLNMRDDCYKRCPKWYCEVAKQPWCPP